ncbi:MAG TPA: cyclase family protein [Steroidobacteraceae bacterium]|nr:cyclase family protein [Steroidobacteraceae bacterium]
MPHADSGVAAWCEIEGRRFQIEVARPHDLAIALDFDGRQPRWFEAPAARSTALASGSFSGRVELGASCNCSSLSLTPHCDGTHTESAGHLTREPLAVRTVVPPGFVPALLLTVTPLRAADTAESSRPPPRPADRLITGGAIRQAWPAAPAFAPRALVLRTLPNAPSKRDRDYREHPAPYLSLEAARLMVDQGIEHLLLDVPSADRADDGGELSAHREFFGLPGRSSSLAAVQRPQCTITELVYVDERIADGSYLLSLQIPALGGEAVPSRPLLYPLRPA